MGAAAIGGLVASTVLSLFVVPVLYTVMDDMEHGVRRLVRRLLGSSGKHAAAARQRGALSAARQRGAASLPPPLRTPRCCRYRRWPGSAGLSASRRATE